MIFFFTFDEERLSLIPKEEEKDEIRYAWFYTKLESGVFAWPGKPKFVEEDFLYGQTNETNRVITFLTNKPRNFRKITVSLQCRFWPIFLVIPTDLGLVEYHLAG